MTLGDKIKQVFHKDKDSTDTVAPQSTGGSSSGYGADNVRPGSNTGYGTNTGTGSGAGGSTRTSNTGYGDNVTPSNTTGQGVTGSQSGSGYNNTGSGSGSGYNNTGTGSGTGAGTGTGTGTGMGSGSTTGTGTGTGSGTGSRVPEGALGQAAGSNTGRFTKGYSENEPGYSERFGVGKPEYHENIREGADGSYSADLSASGGTAEWQRARELTEMAEKEAASAQLAGNKAGRELSAAEQAEEAVRKAQAKHREALLEAEKYRERIQDPSLKEAGVNDAQELYRQKQSMLAEAERALRDAEADLAGKKRDAEKIHPQVEQFGRKLPGLEDEYNQRLRDREAAEGQKDKLLAAMRDAEQNRGRYASELDGLLAELERLERIAHEKQQAYIEARNASQGYSQRVADLKAKLREADALLNTHRTRANKAEQDLPAYREAEQRALRDLEDSKSEWYRLKELEDEYARAYQDANARLQALHGKHDPASKELRDARGLLSSRQDDLDRARQRALAAEGKYRDLLSLADRHKNYGDSAADAAHRHGEKYEDAKREAHIHGDKHVEYWQEAKTHGESGSTEATSAIRKLEEKVKGLMGRSEP